MATSEVQICNRALLRIGQKSTIAALTESSAAAQACRLIYEPARDEMLEEFPWPWAKKQATLALLEDEERTPWSYAYALPADCIKARHIWTGIRRPANDERIPFEIQTKDDLTGPMLLTDQEDVELIYTAKVTAVNVFSPLFADALAWKLAIDLAMGLPVKREFRADAMKMFPYVLSQAQARALDEMHDDPEPDSVFIRSRA